MYFITCMSRFLGLFVALTTVILAVSCARVPEAVKKEVTPTPASATPEVPATLAEILDDKNTETESPLGKFDFLNMTYPLPRGWQDVDSREVTLENGQRRMTGDKIGMSFVTKKFGDVTGDGKDEAFVILRVATGGSATPHIVYVFEQVKGSAEIIWYFRTGDRADGGLKSVYADSGDLIVELFGEDRYIYKQMETLSILGDEPQLCCPTTFTKNRYKRVPGGFKLFDKRLTYSLKDPSAAPKENLGDEKLRISRGTQ